MDKPEIVTLFDGSVKVVHTSKDDCITLFLEYRAKSVEFDRANAALLRDALTAALDLEEG